MNIIEELLVWTVTLSKGSNYKIINKPLYINYNKPFRPKIKYICLKQKQMSIDDYIL
ncbi:Uncharacterised protein [Staphylococcus xylosus]|uniref:hypothetical protein n=1 Tax=Staphylococcus xylosus TaxID=1288 RepID=UPI00086BCC65|nr:hypothetical protein [Staphylococcus xylosus]SCT82005.1 Uncharacterised protein [Staphylococcus xylosus]